MQKLVLDELVGGLWMLCTTDLDSIYKLDMLYMLTTESIGPSFSEYQSGEI